MKIEGFEENAYNFEYIEEETESEIIMTAKAIFKKDSKSAMRRIERSKKKGILPLCTILKGCTQKPRE